MVWIISSLTVMRSGEEVGVARREQRNALRG